ncbi:MAG: hypothetical protein EOP32_34205 [Rhodococcus sp. (in: high G+C Gram-positive bacteria)]|nr:MAG: hypothetical protein EOP32_34205 [Rhodococcus sp. (in: high G+C Gram-positive bacteria)]
MICKTNPSEWATVRPILAAMSTSASGSSANTALPAISLLPTAVGPKHIDELAGALYEISRHHAQRAIANIGTDDPLELIDQAFSIGASLELLTKATLAGIDPHLIRGVRSNNDTTLALIGRPRFVHRLPLLNTIGGKDGVTLLNQITGNSLRPTSSPVLDQLFGVRDSAVHLALVDPAANDAALGQVVRLIDSMLNARAAHQLDGDWDSYWGDHLDVASARLSRAVDQLATEYEQALASAKRTFQRWAIPGDKAGALQAAVQILEEQAPRVESDEVARHHTCPACNSQGWVVYQCNRGNVEIDDGDAPHSLAWFVKVMGQPLYFECNVCRLYLDEDNVELADITEIELDEEEASDEEIELWRDSQYEDAVDMGYPD